MTTPPFARPDGSPDPEPAPAGSLPTAGSATPWSQPGVGSPSAAGSTPPDPAATIPPGPYAPTPYPMAPPAGTYPPATYPPAGAYPQVPATAYPQPPGGAYPPAPHPAPGYPGAPYQPGAPASGPYPQVPAGGYPPATAYPPPATYPPTSGYPPYPASVTFPPNYPQPAPAARGVGKAGLVAIGLVVVALLGAGAAWLVGDRATDPLGEVTAATSAWAGALRPGHCVLELPEDGGLTRVTAVPCDEPHQAEVLATRTVPGQTFPGTEGLVGTVAPGCEMDRTQAELGLVPVVWTPGSDAWSGGHRLSLCLGALPAGTMTGSFVVGDAVAVG